MAKLGRLLYLCYDKNYFAISNTEDTVLDKRVPQKVLGGLDEGCRFCDEFSFFFAKKLTFGNFCSNLYINEYLREKPLELCQMSNDNKAIV